MKIMLAGNEKILTIISGIIDQYKKMDRENSKLSGITLEEQEVITFVREVSKLTKEPEEVVIQKLYNKGISVEGVPVDLSAWKAITVYPPKEKENEDGLR